MDLGTQKKLYWLKKCWLRTEELEPRLIHFLHQPGLKGYIKGYDNFEWDLKLGCIQPSLVWGIMTYFHCLELDYLFLSGTEAPPFGLSWLKAAEDKTNWGGLRPMEWWPQESAVKCSIRRRQSYLNQGPNKGWLDDPLHLHLGRNCHLPSPGTEWSW